MKHYFKLLAFALLLFLTGCITPTDDTGRLKHKKKIVDISSLDWIEIAYYPSPRDPRIKSPCRLSIFGAGEIIFQTGRSPQIWDSMSSATTDPYWNDVYTDRMHLPHDEIQDVFQEYVNEGLIPKYNRFLKQEELGTTYIQIAAQIGMEKVRIRTSNRYLVSLTEDALKNFMPTIQRATDAYRRSSDR